MRTLKNQTQMVSIFNPNKYVFTRFLDLEIIFFWIGIRDSRNIFIKPILLRVRWSFSSLKVGIFEYEF